MTDFAKPQPQMTDDPIWIDGQRLNVGEIGFLVSVIIHRKGHPNVTTTQLYPQPCYRPGGGPLLAGFCGKEENTSRLALGLARVVRMASSGSGRALVEPVEGQEGAKWLRDEAGYPELVPYSWQPPEENTE